MTSIILFFAYVFALLVHRSRRQLLPRSPQPENLLAHRKPFPAKLLLIETMPILPGNKCFVFSLFSLLFRRGRPRTAWMDNIET